MLNHCKARYYDPETGRFLQTDPIGYEDQMNLYAYVGNDPVNATDPKGERIQFQGVNSGNWKQTAVALFKVAQTETGAAALAQLESSSNVHTIVVGPTGPGGNGIKTNINGLQRVDGSNGSGAGTTIS